MTLRKLARELRDYPATSAICLIWIAIFASMTYIELADQNPYLTPTRWLLLGLPGGGGRFGDLTLRELGQGQVWRLITCNFIHFSLIHLGLNLLAMYQLGSMVEEWYGSYQFVCVYAVLGGGGNLVSALIRYGIGWNPEVHSGGGSVVIMGLVGLCAVVGWRVRDRWGKSLSRLMTLFLVLTAIMGILLPRIHRQLGPCRRCHRGRPGGVGRSPTAGESLEAVGLGDRHDLRADHGKLWGGPVYRIRAGGPRSPGEANSSPARTISPGPVTWPA